MELLSIFAVLENIKDITNGKFSFYYGEQQNYKDHFFSGNLKISRNGNVTFSLDFIDEKSRKFSNYQWLNKETLSDYIYDNAGIILKKIPIEIDTLNPLFRNAVRLQIKSKQKTLS